MTKSKPHHPHEEHLRAFVAGAMSVEEATSVETHLQSCERCCDIVAQWSAKDPFIANVRLALSGEPSVDRSVSATESSLRLLRSLQQPSVASSSAIEPSELDNADANDAQLPKRIGRFEVGEQIGDGSFGVVWRGFDTLLRRDVAIKIPRLASFATAASRERFHREARAAASLSHVNILPVYESGNDGGLGYIAAEYCPGPDLSQWLHQNGRPDPVTAAEIVCALAGGLHHAHERGVCHRDLKPANILLAPIAEGSEASRLRFIPKITDFGLAKIQGEDTNATRSRCLLGTAGYMAPEMATGRVEAAGPASDIYALGAVLYELLTLRQPISGVTEFETLRLIQSATPSTPSKICPGTPRDLEVIAMTCLQKDPAHRYANAQLLQDDLRRFLHGKPIFARPAGRVERVWRWTARNPRLATACSVAAMLCVVIVVVLGIANVKWRLLNTELNHTLWNSHLERAELSRTSTAMGRRFNSLQAIERARDMMSALDHGEKELAELRCRAVAAMALTDLRVERSIVQAIAEDRTCLAWDPRLQRFATPQLDGTIHIRDVDTDRIQIYQSPAGTSIRLLFSADGATLAGAVRKGTEVQALLWRLADDVVDPVSMGECAPLGTLQFVRDQDVVVVHGAPDELRFHDTRTGKLKRRLTIAESAGFRVSPDGTQVVVWLENELSLHDLHTGAKKAAFTIGDGLRRITAAAWSDDARTLAMGGSDHSIHLLNLDDVEIRQTQTYIGHSDWIASLEFIAADRILSTDIGGELRIWDLTAATTILQTVGSNIVRSYDGGRVAGSVGTTAVRWQLLNERVRHVGFVAFFPYEVTDLVPMSNCKMGISFDSQKICFWDLDAIREIHEIPVHPAPTSIVAATSETMLATSNDRLFQYDLSLDGHSSGWVVSHGRQILVPHIREQDVTIRATRSGSTLAVGSENQILLFRMHGTVEPQPFLRVDVPGLKAFHLSDTDRWILTRSSSEIALWNANTGEREPTIARIEPARAPDHGSVRMGPRDQLLAWARGGLVELWSRKGKTVVRRISRGPSAVTDFEFSPDGRFIALTSKGNPSIAVFQADTGRLVAELPAESSRPWFAFTRDGRYLMHRGKQMSVEFWDMELIVRRLRELRLLDDGK